MVEPMNQAIWWRLVPHVTEPKEPIMNFDEWRESVLVRNQIKEAPEHSVIMEVIANMKSNRGDSQQWAKELEDALGVEPIVGNNDV
jgi:hypothetical protein